MQIILHTGAHATDDERLLKCLLNNKADFANRGTAVPGPSKFRNLLKESFAAMQTADPSSDARDVLMDAILDDEVADRLILSNPNFFGSHHFTLQDGELYPLAAERIGQMQRLFQPDQIELFMAIRNPATFLPAVWGGIPPKRLREKLGGKDPREVRWSDMIEKIRTVAPDMPITIWCNEDTPLIWAQIIRELAGLDHGEKITGGFDLLKTLMTPEGMRRFRAYLKSYPVMTEIQKRRVIEAFLDKFAIEERMIEELDLPGWTTELVDEMTEIYDDDVFRLQHMPGVQLIEP